MKWPSETDRRFVQSPRVTQALSQPSEPTASQAQRLVTGVGFLIVSAFACQRRRTANSIGRPCVKIGSDRPLRDRIEQAGAGHIDGPWAPRKPERTVTGSFRLACSVVTDSCVVLLGCARRESWTQHICGEAALSARSFPGRSPRRPETTDSRSASW